MAEDEKTFDDYWDDAVEEDETGVSKSTEEHEEEELKDQEEVVADPEADDDEVKPEKDEEDEEVDDHPAQTVEEQLAAVQAENESLKHKMSSWQGRITKANERAKEAEEKLASVEKHGKVVTDTEEVASTEEDEDTVLKEFKEEFPELIEPFKIMAKKYAKQIADESLGKVTPVIEDIQEKQKLSAREEFDAPIYEAHSDWFTIYESGDLQKWIDTQPPLQQRVYVEIIKNGSQAEIIDMFTTYKKDNNISQTTTEKSTSGKEDSEEVKSIVAVPASSAGPVGDPPDKDDFDSAWKEATSQK